MPLISTLNPTKMEFQYK